MKEELEPTSPGRSDLGGGDECAGRISDSLMLQSPINFKTGAAVFAELRASMRDIVPSDVADALTETIFGDDPDRVEKAHLQLLHLPLAK